MPDLAQILDALPRRILRKVEFEPNSGCWLWTGAITRGYGCSYFGKRNQYAHRVVYQMLVGPIPDGLTLDHLCRTPSCVNPAHLEPVTSRENSLRGISPAAIAAKATHCPKGHAYDAENTYVRKNGHRTCRRCCLDASARRHARRCAEQGRTPYKRPHHAPRKSERRILRTANA